ncbi:MAG: beta-ketoacyl synthase N-terminal-like domain-containing protein [Bacteroidota bacterium]
MTYRKVAIVGMGGVFPDCEGLEEFASKLFSNQSLVRIWPEAELYGRQVRSIVSGYVSLAEMDLERSSSA